jgi:hypothetical protein
MVSEMAGRRRSRNDAGPSMVKIPVLALKIN